MALATHPDHPRPVDDEPLLEALAPGDRVEVLLRFDRSWADGFEVVDVLGGRTTRWYALRRRSDGTVLPVPFPERDVRLAA